MEGDDDEDEIDDIEHEFNIDDERKKQEHVVDAMLHGKMSYGRGHDDEDTNTQFPPVIAGVRSRQVIIIITSNQNKNNINFTYIK